MKYHQAAEMYRFACDTLARFSENYVGELNRDCDSFINSSTNLDFNFVSDCNGYYLQGVCYHQSELVALSRDLSDRALIVRFINNMLDRFYTPLHGIRQMTILEALQHE